MDHDTVDPACDELLTEVELSRYDSKEAYLSGWLWHWAFLSRDDRGKLTATARMCPSVVEFYLCDVFPLVEFTRSRGVWCDGILDLRVEQLHRRAFRLMATAYCPHALAPVEIEFHFARRRDPRPDREIVRFGSLTPAGELHTYPNPPKRLASIVEDRPRRDRDWAIAVELTSGD